MEIWIATGNKGKLNEFKVLLSQLEGAQVHASSELPTFFAPPENGKTYTDNARIKAKALKAVKPGVWVIGDDSGLECEGMNGMPGIHSARYAGDKASDAENRAKLLKMLKIRSSNRKALFRCVLAVYSPTGEEFIFEGVLNGSIAQAEKGLHGFGYDSIFIPDGETQTMAELSPAYKNKNSHRAQATQLLVEKLKSI